MSISSDNQDELKANLTSLELFSLAFGAIIGVSWVILVGDWISSAGSIGAITAFVLGGSVIIPVGYCYARLGQHYPVVGGEFVYAYRFFGNTAAFVTAWVLALLYISICAFEAISVAWIFSTIFDGATGPYLYSIFDADLHTGDFAVGVLVTLLLAWTHVSGTELAARLQDILTGFLLIATICFVLAALWFGAPDNLDPIFNAPEGQTYSSAVLSLFVLTPVFFAGFGAVPQAMGESSGAARAGLVRLIVLILVASIFFYVAVIFASAYIAPLAMLLQSDLPAAKALEIAFGDPLYSKVVLVAGMLGLVTTWNAVLFAGARVLFALGHGRLGPAFLARGTGEHNAPRNAIIVVTVITLLAVPLGRNALIPIVSLSGLCIALVFLTTCLCLLRADIPKQKWLAVAGLVVSLFLLALNLYEMAGELLDCNYLRTFTLVVWMLLGFVVFRASRMIREETPTDQRDGLIIGRLRRK